jgi:hypothetical protein
MLNPDPNFEGSLLPSLTLSSKTGDDDDDPGLIYNTEEVELGAQQVFI